MTGSGLGNFGLAGAGQQMANFYGQQPWAEDARRKFFIEKYGSALSRMTTNPTGASQQQKMAAADYASSFLPLGASLGGGLTIQQGRFTPSAGINVPSSVSGGTGFQSESDWWRRMPQYQFPMMG